MLSWVHHTVANFVYMVGAGQVAYSMFLELFFSSGKQPPAAAENTDESEPNRVGKPNNELKDTKMCCKAEGNCKVTW